MRRTFFVALLLAASLARAQEDPKLWREYYEAVRDSAVYAPSKLRLLKPLEVDAKGNVLVVALGPDPFPKGTMTTTREIWVTLVPEVQTKCKQYGPDAPMRLRQLLGLPPYSPKAYTVFNTFTVPAGSVFRPAPDPETATKLPCPGTASWTGNGFPPNCGNVFPQGTADAHIQWMAGNSLFSYQETDHPSGSQPTVGYPWTHLGYTFNYHSGDDRYGASEYVVMKGTIIDVVSSASIAEYCK